MTDGFQPKKFVTLDSYSYSEYTRKGALIFDFVYMTDGFQPKKFVTLDSYSYSEYTRKGALIFDFVY